MSAEGCGTAAPYSATDRKNCVPRSAVPVISRISHTNRSAIRLAFSITMAADKRFVYVLKNADQRPRFYVGLTSDVNARVSEHNTGRCPHTASRGPWARHVIIEFPDEGRAVRFERYLKSGSGRAFAKRHFEQ